MLYKGDTLYLDWLEDGIAEQKLRTLLTGEYDSHNALVQLINSTLRPSPASARPSACWNSNQI